MIRIKKRYVEIEVPEEQEQEQDAKSEHEPECKDKHIEDDDICIQLEKDLQIPLEKLDKDKTLMDITLRLGKMRVQDIAYDLNINIPTVKKHRKEILGKLGEIQKVIIISQEQKIEELREKILTGKMKRRPHNYSFGVEGLVTGIVRDLTTQGKSISEIVEQTNIEKSTVSYHREKIKSGRRRKYPPRIMNMSPNKDVKVAKLLKKNKRQRDICKILDISSATASTIVNKVRDKN